MSRFDIVTGGCGFIGSALVAELRKRGRSVSVIDLQEGVDIRQPLAVADGVEIDTIYHLAALADIVPSIENPVAYYDTNVTGTLNVLEFARKVGCKKFVYAASSSCYGAEENFNANEHADCQTAYPYALTKYLGEQIAGHWGRVYGIPVISLRLFNVYGEKQKASNSYGAMFKIFLAQLANGKPLTIVGSGYQRRDFVHVSDVVAAFIAAAESNIEDCIFNIGTGNTEAVINIARMLSNKYELVEGEDYVTVPERPGEPSALGADISAAKAYLKWEPKVTIAQGVRLLREHLDDYRDSPVWTPDTIKDATAAWFERLSA